TRRNGTVGSATFIRLTSPVRIIVKAMRNPRAPVPAPTLPKTRRQTSPLDAIFPRKKKPRTRRGFPHQNREAPLLDDPDDTPCARRARRARLVEVDIAVLGGRGNLVAVQGARRRPPAHDPLAHTLVAPRRAGHKADHAPRQPARRANGPADDAAHRTARAITLM